MFFYSSELDHGKQSTGEICVLHTWKPFKMEISVKNINIWHWYINIFVKLSGISTA